MGPDHAATVALRNSLKGVRRRAKRQPADGT
jgi:hypothetical protein